MTSSKYLLIVAILVIEVNAVFFLHKSIYFTYTNQNTLGNATYDFRTAGSGGGVYEGETTAWSGITIYPSTGNFDSGTFVLYGLKK
jgi:hypothetical protein